MFIQLSQKFESIDQFDGPDKNTAKLSTDLRPGPGDADVSRWFPGSKPSENLDGWCTKKAFNLSEIPIFNHPDIRKFIGCFIIILKCQFKCFYQFLEFHKVETCTPGARLSLLPMILYTGNLRVNFLHDDPFPESQFMLRLLAQWFQHAHDQAVKNQRWDNNHQFFFLRLGYVQNRQSLSTSLNSMRHDPKFESPTSNDQYHFRIVSA